MMHYLVPTFAPLNFVTNALICFQGFDAELVLQQIKTLTDRAESQEEVIQELQRRIQALEGSQAPAVTLTLTDENGDEVQDEV